MIIWKAQMNLIYNIDNEWEITFKFEKQEENYKDNNDEYLYSEGWISTRIPKSISIRESYGNIISEIGFNKQLNEIELEELKIEMKNKITEYINIEKEKYLKTFKEKLKAIN